VNQSWSGAFCLLAFSLAYSGFASAESKPIVDVRIDAPYRQIEASYGDEWAPTWGRNDVLYTGSNDGSSFGHMDVSAMAFGKLEGDGPYRLKGTSISGLDEFKEPTLPGPEGAAWRSLGSYEIDGMFYRFAACAPDQKHHACIARSSDGGKSWDPIASKLVLPGHRLGHPTFITYRDDLRTISEALQGNSFRQYAYFALYSGVANGKNQYIVGRIPKNKLAAADDSDWRFQAQDGKWQPDPHEAVPQSDDWVFLGADRANWKTTNTYSIGGDLYAFVLRCEYPWMAGDSERRHVFRDSSVIKSTDGGVTWSRSPAANMEKPMFRGKRFGAPYFIWYGKDGAAKADYAGRYVYAISNNGHFEAGDDYVLGRVLRSKLGDLQASDWEFYRSGDGMVDGSWTSSLAEAEPVLKNPGRAGMTGVTYIEALGRYVMVSWHYSQVSFATAIERKDLSTVLEFFEAPKPWGPWTNFKALSTGQLGWYAPIIGQRFQISTGSHEVKAFLITTGLSATPEGGVDFKRFKFNYMPLTLSTRVLRHSNPGYVGGH
jgi:hypothetical protein